MLSCTTGFGPPNCSSNGNKKEAFCGLRRAAGKAALKGICEVSFRARKSTVVTRRVTLNGQKLTVSQMKVSL